MSKFTKLLRDPVAYFRDAVRNRRGLPALPHPTSTLDIPSKTRAAEKKGPVNRSEPIPTWFQAQMGPFLRDALKQEMPTFLFLPWIAEHGDLLISRIEDPEKNYQIVPLDFVKNLEDNAIRREVLSYARSNPHLYRRMIARRLIPLRNRISGVIFSFDWAPVMRIIASVCEELGIPRILIPHESVFVSRGKYYWDFTAHASVPVADVVLGWGNLQRDIFVERGYPERRFVAVGAPKFDPYSNYQPQLTRQQFSRVFGLDPERKIILFASQPLDSQLDTRKARDAQRAAIKDLLMVSDERGLQVIVRLPPSKDNILGTTLQELIDHSPNAAVDDANCYLVAPEEALYHADLVTSLNSTMLFEGVLMGRPALSMKYIEFESFWGQAGIPAAHNFPELVEALDRMVFTPGWKPDAAGLAWAAEMFSTGEFDGGASSRIVRYLRSITEGETKLSIRPSAIMRLLDPTQQDGMLDVVAVSIPHGTPGEIRDDLATFLNARTVVTERRGFEDISLLASSDLFVHWGMPPDARRDDSSAVRSALGRPQVIMENGLIYSNEGNLRSSDRGLSVILDDTTAYYDTTRHSRLQRLLQSGPNLTTEQTLRAYEAIAQIVRTRISKFSHSPSFPLSIGSPTRKKILLIDQKVGNPSVEAGLADHETFERMLEEVLRLRGDCDIIIKPHPDTIKGKAPGYFSSSRLASSRHLKQVHVLDFEVNSYCLFELVEEVHVVTSDVGFEALMAGKKVHCHGAPFFSGWGVTQDKIRLPLRTRKRSVEEIFHFAYIECSRYFHPKLRRTVSIEEFVEYLTETEKH